MSNRVLDLSERDMEQAETPTPPYNLAPATTLSRVESLADTILHEVGIAIEHHPPSLEALRNLGASITGERVHISGARIREFIRDKIPRSFTWQGRTPDTHLNVGINAPPVFAPVYGPPKVKRLNGEIIERATLAEYEEFIRLSDAAPALGTTGFLTCFVHEIPEPVRHIKMAEAHLKLSDKPFMGTVFSPTATHEVIDLLGRGKPPQNTCNLLHLINSTPPLRYKQNPLECLHAAASRGEGCIITSYMMMGATSPLSIMETLAQGYAEILIGLALTQSFGAGSPAVFGLYAMPFSMQYMVPIFGNPLANQVQMIGMQLARRLNIPARGDGGVTSAKTDDAQAGYEGGHATLSAVMGGADIVMHSAGWLESGRCADMQKFTRESAFLQNTPFI